MDISKVMRGACGVVLVCAGCGIATGRLLSPQGTEKKVTWQRGLAGGAIALTGVALMRPR